MIPVPPIRRANQVRAMALGYLAFCVLYLGSSALPAAGRTTLAPGPLDAWVPSLGWTVWLYFSQFLLLPAAIVLARDDADRSRLFYAALVATVLAAAVFVAWPTRMERAAITQQGLTGLAWRLLYLADTPANCFPSLHVALAAIAGWALWRRGIRVAATLWPLAIAVSTLTTRQHVAWDILGGLALAALALWLTPRILRLEHVQFTPRRPAGA